MATQRITIAKIAGQAATAVRARFAEWSAARKIDKPDYGSPEQWPDDSRRAMDPLAVVLRSENPVFWHFYPSISCLSGGGRRAR